MASKALDDRIATNSRDDAPVTAPSLPTGQIRVLTYPSFANAEIQQSGDNGESKNSAEVQGSKRVGPTEACRIGS